MQHVLLGSVRDMIGVAVSTLCANVMHAGLLVLCRKSGPRNAISPLLSNS